MARHLRRTARVVILALLLFLDFACTTPIFRLPDWFLPVAKPAQPGFLGGWARYWRENGGLAGQEAILIWQQRPVGWWIYQVPWAVLAYFVAGGTLPFRPRRQITTTHGSARWRTRRELSNSLQRVPLAVNKPDATQDGGIVCGIADGRTCWRTQPGYGSPHVLVLGATRSGKSRRVLLPSMYLLGRDGIKPSLILTDPKGELWQQAAGYLAQAGYRTVLVDLEEPRRGNLWNPLTPIRQAWCEGDKDRASRLAWDLAYVLTPRTDRQDPIWGQTQEAFTAALALLVATSAQDETAHLASAFRLIQSRGSDPESLDAVFAALPDDHPARGAWGSVRTAESRLWASIAVGTAAQLRLFGEVGIMRLTSSSDHLLEDVRSSPHAVFLRLPETAVARGSLATLYLTQLYAAVTASPSSRPIWFMLDELGNIPAIPNFDRLLSLSAGRGIRFCLALQDLQQLDATYGVARSRTVQANVGTTIFLGTADTGTAEVISRASGTESVSTMSRTQSASRDSFSEGETARRLIMPDEVLRWRNTHSLVLQAGQLPARLPIQDVSKWPYAPVSPPTLKEVSEAREIEFWQPENLDQNEVLDLAEVFAQQPEKGV